MGKKLVVLLLVVSAVAAHGESLLKKHDPLINFGVKVGLNSMKPFVHSFQVNDVDVQGMYLHYRVGYSATLFTRINIGRFYLQPGISWEASQCSFFYHEEPSQDQEVSSNLSNRLQVRTFSVPVSFGYYLVKDYPYALSIRSGTKKNFRYQMVYNSSESNYILLEEEGVQPFLSNLALFSVLEVEIGKFIFDIGYQFALSRVTYRFEQESFTRPAPITSINMRMEGLSMSVGISF